MLNSRLAGLHGPAMILGTFHSLSLGSLPVPQPYLSETHFSRGGSPNTSYLYLNLGQHYKLPRGQGF